MTLQKKDKNLPSYLVGRAFKLWNSGMDTTDIAVQLECREYQVYNSLSAIRDWLGEEESA